MKNLILISTFAFLICARAEAQLATTNYISPAALKAIFNSGSTNFEILPLNIWATNYAMPVSFEPINCDPPTNIIIYSNYTGTIQVGTNFYTIKDLTPESKTNIQWLGFITYGRIETNYIIDDVKNNVITKIPSWQQFNPSAKSSNEIGLRADGVLVWRAKQSD